MSASIPTPVQAGLLFDDTHAGERDERFPGVYLLAVSADGQEKTTGRLTERGWFVAEWELTDEMEGPLGGERYWFTRHSFAVPGGILGRMIEIQLEQRLGKLQGGEHA